MKYATIILLTLACLLGGCGAGGKLSVKSQDQPKTQDTGDFDHGLYRMEGKGGITAVLVDGPMDNPARIVSIRVLWPPRTARTPLDPDATNATVRYVVFEGDQVGVYSGAGFAYPKGRLGGSSLRVSIEEANLRLTDSIPGFQDRLGAALARGGFTVRRADDNMTETLRTLSLRVSDALGYPQFVRAD